MANMKNMEFVYNSHFLPTGAKCHQLSIFCLIVPYVMLLIDAPSESYLVQYYIFPIKNFGLHLLLQLNVIYLLEMHNSELKFRLL